MVRGDQQSGGREYYGVLRDIIQIDYGVERQIVLFKYEWRDTYHEGKGYKKELNGIIPVNVKHNLRSNEPYVLACQVEQVYYVADNKNKDWRLVIKITPHHFYDVPLKDNEDSNEEEIHLYDIDVGLSPLLDIVIDDDDTKILLQRTDVEAMTSDFVFRQASGTAVHMQNPTPQHPPSNVNNPAGFTLASPRDFWILRYTIRLENESLVICMRSLTASIRGPSGPTTPNLVRVEMLSSGYLIRPCEGGGSMINIVYHLDLDILEVVRLEGHGLNQDDFLARDLHLLQEPLVIRVVMKCIEEHELEAKFLTTENLHKRLENLQKVKVEKRKVAGGLVNNCTRMNNGGPMPLAN
ncbi:Homeobox-leucine zipper protein HOX32 [Platanthera zijinensis]|uniref:Homeobox-leucine zipper protein HOX32 n=1 Tax=Platanthera zijinensis TaxID=2320716 RepID=A0AAP0B221_9ASPA